MTDWQSIETAPRDGSEIIVRRRQNYYGAPLKHPVMRAKYLRDHWLASTLDGQWKQMFLDYEIEGWRPLDASNT